MSYISGNGNSSSKITKFLIIQELELSSSKNKKIVIFQESEISSIIFSYISGGNFTSSQNDNTHSESISYTSRNGNLLRKLSIFQEVTC